MFNYAIGKARGLPYDFDRVIERSPFEGLEMKRRTPVKDPNRVRIATPEQVAGIAAEMKPHVRFAVYIAAWAGLTHGRSARATSQRLLHHTGTKRHTVLHLHQTAGSAPRGRGTRAVT